MADLVAVRMQPAFLSTVKRVADAQGFLSVQEYVRDAVRRDVYNYYKMRLDEITASAKGKRVKRLTPAQRQRSFDKMAREVREQEAAGTWPKDAREQIERILAKKRL